MLNLHQVCDPITVDCEQMSEYLLRSSIEPRFHLWVHLFWFVNAPATLVQDLIDTVRIYFELCLHILCGRGQVALTLLSDVVLADELVEVYLNARRLHAQL